MTSFIIFVSVAALICWGIEAFCKIASVISSSQSEFTQDWQILKAEAFEIKEEVQSLGWKIFIPLTPLVALVSLVFWAIRHGSN